MEARASRFPRSVLARPRSAAANEFFKAWGETDVAEAHALIDICLEAGVNLFDTADGYSDGRSEEILGKAMADKRDRVLISTKANFPTGEGPNDRGSSRYHLRRALEASLRRLRHRLHRHLPHARLRRAHAGRGGAGTLNSFVRDGKVRYIACSNFSGWHLMKSLAISDRYGWTRYVGHQVYYSLVGREYEWELMPLGSSRESARWCGARWAGAG